MVRGLQQNFIDTEVITGSKKGERVFIPRFSLEPSESSLPFKMRMCQFLVILAFVLTTIIFKNGCLPTGTSNSM